MKNRAKRRTGAASSCAYIYRMISLRRLSASVEKAVRTTFVQYLRKFQIAGVADQTVVLGAVRAVDRYPEEIRHSCLSVVGKLRKSLTSQSQNAYEIVFQWLVEILRHVVVDDIDVEVYVITEKYVVSDKIAECLCRFTDFPENFCGFADIKMLRQLQKIISGKMIPLAVDRQHPIR